MKRKAFITAKQKRKLQWESRANMAYVCACVRVCADLCPAALMARPHTQQETNQ